MGVCDEPLRRELLLGGAVVVGGGLVLPFGSSASTAGVSTLAAANFPVPYKARFTPSPKLSGRVMEGTLEDGSEGRYRLFTIIEEQAGAKHFVPGKTTRYGYSYIDDSGIKRPVKVPGPILDVHRVDTRDGVWADGSPKYGLPAKVRVINRLPQTHPQFGHTFKTSTHLHGSASLPQYDGYADDVTYPGEYKDYWYPTSRTPGRSGTTTTGCTTPRRTPTAVSPRSTTCTTTCRRTCPRVPTTSA